MRNVAEQMLNDPEAAADAVQETLTLLWHKRWRLSLMKNPQGFAMTTLKNQTVSTLRRRSRLSPISEAPPLADNVGEALVAEQRYRQLEKALETLPPLGQQIIRMRYVENLSTKEMAARLKMSEENVNTTISRAYKKLRNEMLDEI